MFALVPILAQATTTVAVGDRTEVRARFDDRSGTAEASTSPYGSIAFANTREGLTLRYAPLLTLTTLSGTSPRTLLVYHTAQVIGQLRWKRLSLQLSETGDYGERNFRAESLARGVDNAPPPTGAIGPAPGAPTPPAVPGSNPNLPGMNTGTGSSVANQSIAASGKTVAYGDLITQANLSYTLSRQSSTGAYARYTVAGGVGETSQLIYPTVYSASLGAFYSHSLSKLATVATTLQGSYTTSSNGIDSYTSDLSAGFRYQFSKTFGLTTTFGIGYARVNYPGAEYLEYIYLTAGGGTGLGAEYRTKLEGGMLVLYARVGYGLSLDQVTAQFDPRINWALGASWSKRRTTLYAAASSSISVKFYESDAFGSVGTAVGAAYMLGDNFIADFGARTAFQTYQGTQTIPPSYALFAGLSWGAKYGH